jgi:outer membrane protein OmpA-like peptidoglycan-associated protein
MIDRTAEPDLFSLPELPYAGSSGHRGSSTSKARADNADRSGRTKNRQETVLRHLSARRGLGATWRDIADLEGWHHGTASGTLSVLHKTQHIDRLTEQRDRCKIYVLPEYVADRTTEPYGGSIQGRIRNQREAFMLTERQTDILINGQDILVNQVARTLADRDHESEREQAEKVISTVADWLSKYRPADFGDEFCTPLDVTAFILRRGQFPE